MENKVFLKDIAELLELDISEISFETELVTIKGWDSVAVLEIITLCDTRYNINLDIDLLFECKTIQDIYQLIKPC